MPVLGLNVAELRHEQDETMIGMTDRLLAEVLCTKKFESWRYCLRHHTDMATEVKEIHEIIGILERFNVQALDSPQWQVLRKLFQLELVCDSKNELVRKVMKLFAKEVVGLFDRQARENPDLMKEEGHHAVPNEEELKHFSEKLRKLRGVQFKGFKLSWWGEQQRFPKQASSTADFPNKNWQESDSGTASREDIVQKRDKIDFNVDELKDFVKDQIEKCLGDSGITRKCVCHWLTASLKSSVLEGNYKFLDTVWVARLGGLSEGFVHIKKGAATPGTLTQPLLDKDEVNKHVLGWAAMGELASRMLAEGVISEGCFAYHGYEMARSFHKLATVVTPGFVSKLRTIELQLQEKVMVVQDLKTRILAGTVAAILCFCQFLLHLFFQEVVPGFHNATQSK